MDDAYPIRFADQMREHLRSLRKKRSLTQAQLGALAGVSQARIAEIEAKPGLVNLDQMLQLLSLLGASLSLAVDDMPASPHQPAHGITRTASKPPKAKAVRTARPAKAPAGVPNQVSGGVTLRKKRGSW